jgi:hypothetical protein
MTSFHTDNNMAQIPDSEQKSGTKEVLCPQCSTKITHVIIVPDNTNQIQHWVFHEGCGDIIAVSHHFLTYFERICEQRKPTKNEIGIFDYKTNKFWALPSDDDDKSSGIGIRLLDGSVTSFVVGCCFVDEPPKADLLNNMLTSDD